MRRHLAVVVVLVFTVAAVQAQERGKVDWIFLVDTSKSMLKNDVFGDVQKSLKTFVAEASDGDSIGIYTFDREVRPHSFVDISGRNREDLYQVIDSLQADGNRTHLGAAIARGLERAESLLPRDPANTRTRAVVLFTDGKEDVRGIANPVTIPSNIQRALNGRSSIFFVSMDEHEPQLREFPNARFLEATNSEAIRKVAEEIRTTIVKEAPPPPVAKPVVQPRPIAPPLPPPEPSFLARAVKWAVAIAILLIPAFFLLARYKAGNQLEREIEIVQPRIASGSAFVGLPTLGASEVALSSIVPLDALAGSDARLFVRRRNGEKQVCIAASSGSLRVNDIEVPATELYDADTIRIGDAQLRFNRVGFERPQEDQA
jgi:hypothetical protein